MSSKWWTCLIFIMLSVATSALATESPTKGLRVYGPGGPHHVIKECAQLYHQKHGVKVEVLPHDLIQSLRDGGDLYYGGAEYMLEEFNSSNPGLLDMTTRENLHPRRIGVLVRKGNPLAISDIEDLGIDGVDILDVKLERMKDFHPPSKLAKNIRHFEYTGQQGVDAWRTTPELDAWVTYKSWHFLLKQESDFIEITGDAGLRYTPIALTSDTPHRQEAIRFISFLKSAEAVKVFEAHGWY